MAWYDVVVLIAGLAIVAVGIWGALRRVKKTLWDSSDSETPPEHEG